MNYSYDDNRGTPLNPKNWWTWLILKDNEVRFGEIALGLEVAYWDMRYAQTVEELAEQAMLHNPRNPAAAAAQRFVDGMNSTQDFREQAIKHILALTGN